jgi:hypothetical protein
MVLCFVALFVFAFLGIFSMRYRRLAAEAFDCVFRSVTLRPCTSKLDERIKAKIVSKALAGRMPRTAKFVNKYFTAISWVFVILTVVSLFFTIQGVYNYVAYGNCNGPHSSEFCVFNPLANTSPTCGSAHCAENGCNCGGLEANCTASNNFLACNGSCDCIKTVCGGN